MNTMLRFTPIAAALVLAASASVQAQTSRGSVAQTPQRPAPATFAAPTPGPGAPAAAGLSSPVPSPGGLTSRFPAGLPSPSPFPAGMPPVASPVVPSFPPASAGTGTAAGTSSGTVITTTATGTIVTPAIDGTILSQPAMTGGAGVASGGGAYAAGAAAGTAAGTPGQTMGAPAAPSGSFGPGPYTALQLSQSFLAADANRDGELTRAEAQRLTIMPLGFDDMDRDKNGVISRSEYDDAAR